MLRSVAVALAGLAMTGFTGQALAVTNTKTVDVNISVTPTVSTWHTPSAVSLVLDGGAINEDAEDTSMGRINNVTATLKVGVTPVGSFYVSPVSGGGINFFVFFNSTAAAAIAAMPANNYNPAGSVGWLNGDFTAVHTIGSFPATVSAIDTPVAYAANNPGDLAPVGSWDLDVIWTFTDTP